jgi:hypothetical protein
MLKELTIESDFELPGMYSSYEMVPLHRFKNLESLRLAWNNASIGWYMTADLISLIKRCPDLRRLHLHRLYMQKNMYTDSATNVLQELFAKTSLELEVLTVTEISPVLFRGGLSSFIPITSRLVVLEIRDANAYHIPWTSKIPWAAVWLACINQNVRLKSLSVSGIEQTIKPLFQYLLSFTGLEKLEIEINVNIELYSENDAGLRFWEQVVPHHKDTLLELQIIPKYVGDWCYGPSAAEAIESCSRLTKLKVGVCNMDSSWASQKICGRQQITDNTEFSATAGRASDSIVSLS